MRSGYINDGRLLCALFDLGYDPMDNISLYLEKEPSQQMDDTILENAQKHYDEYAEEVADIYCKLFRCSNFRKPEKGKAPSKGAFFS